LGWDNGWLTFSHGALLLEVYAAFQDLRAILLFGCQNLGTGEAIGGYGEQKFYPLF